MAPQVGLESTVKRGFKQHADQRMTLNTTEGNAKRRNRAQNKAPCHYSEPGGVDLNQRPLSYESSTQRSFNEMSGQR